MTGRGSSLLIDHQLTPVERLQPSGDEAGTAPEDRRFRPDVQGLRAIAVTLVLLFHARVPGMGGGYVGVDVFFVISGFVITGVLLRERASKGSTSIASFYARRVRRIIPAATLVIVVAVIASYAVLGPVSGAQTAGDARWASFFLINVHFASTGTNYLASQLPPSVLQNYWSLAVEEQFYLVYPTIFLVIAGLSLPMSLRRRLAIVLGGAAVLSFVISVVQTSNNPTAAYFSPLPRVWELALGGLVAISTVGLRRLSASIAAVLSWVGLAFIILAAVSFSSSTPYPGFAVALPVVGAAMVIAGGVSESSYGAEIALRLKPFQWLGLISYSLYLWHWPVLTIAAEDAGGTLSVWHALGWELLSVVLAVITYRLLENPIRHSGHLIAKRWATLALGGCLIISSFAIATVELHAHGSETLAAPGLAGLNTGAECPSPTQQELRSLEGRGPGTSDRVVARILLVGDSTACTMLPGLEAVGGPVGVRVEDASVVGCGVVSGEIAPSFIDGRNVNASTRTCQRRAIASEDRALHSGRPNVVLWASSWERSAFVVGSGTHQRVLVPGTPQWHAVLVKRMETRARMFTKTGATVVMLTQPPFTDSGSPSSPTARDIDFERLNSVLAQVASQTPRVRLVNLSAYVCPNGPPCPISVDNVWVRPDEAHYSSQGSLWVARWLMPRLGIKALDRPLTPLLPFIRIVSVKNRETVTGRYPLLAVSSLDFGIAKFEFQATGPAAYSIVIGPASFGHGFWGVYWNTSGAPRGTYVLRAIAYNSAGGRSVSKGIAVRVKNTTG